MSTPTIPLPLAPAEALSNTDLCDACGAKAQILIVLYSSGELLLCGHHGHAHRAALEEVAVYIDTIRL